MKTCMQGASVTNAWTQVLSTGACGTPVLPPPPPHPNYIRNVYVADDLTPWRKTVGLTWYSYSWRFPLNRVPHVCCPWVTYWLHINAQYTTCIACSTPTYTSIACMHACSTPTYISNRTFVHAKICTRITYVQLSWMTEWHYSCTYTARS